VAGEKGGVLGVSILTRGHRFLAEPPLQPSARQRITTRLTLRARQAEPAVRAVPALILPFPVLTEEQAATPLRPPPTSAADGAAESASCGVRRKSRGVRPAPYS
jgi:hypothetical protein